MVSIGEQDLGAGVFQALGKLGFDRGLCAHGHKKRGLDFVVEGAEGCGASARARGLGIELEVQTGSVHKVSQAAEREAR